VACSSSRRRGSLPLEAPKADLVAQLYSCVELGAINKISYVSGKRFSFCQAKKWEKKIPGKVREQEAIRAREEGRPSTMEGWGLRVK
jgi:hypothetical protein